MARPIHADAQATQGRILAAASQLFSEKGLGPASMRSIASEAGVSMATVHHYYGGKADLYRACIEEMYRKLGGLRHELESEVVPTIRDTGSLAATVDQAVRGAYRFARAHRPAIQLMMRTVLDTGQLEADKRERFLLPFLENGAELIAPICGQTIAHVRLTLLSINHLIVRFTLSTTTELALVIGAPSATPEQCIRAIEEHLVTTTQSLLALQGPQLE